MEKSRNYLTGAHIKLNNWRHDDEQLLELDNIIPVGVLFIRMRVRWFTRTRPASAVPCATAACSDEAAACSTT
jgi:hypothetical protein